MAGSAAPPEPAATRGSRARRLLADVSPLRHDRDFRFLWVGQVVSTMGRQVTVVVLPYQLYVLTGSPLSIGLLALVQLVPILVFALGGGAMADAVDRRRLLLVTQTALACCSVLLCLISLLPAPPVVLLYVVAFFSAGIGAVDQPARTSATPRLVPRERLTAAIALNQLGFQASAVIGPALGGLILVTVGIAPAYLIDVLTFAAAIAALLLIHPIPPTPGAARPSLATIREGLHFVRRRPAILGSFVVDLNAMIFGMPSALFPIMALDVFKVGPAGLGLMNAAPALGALVGAVLTGWTTRVRRVGWAVIWAVAVWGVAITGFGLASFSFPLALLCLAVAGAADVISAVFRSTLLQVSTPDELRGRVSAIHILVVTSGPRLGDAEASAMAALVGAKLSAISGGILSLVGLAATAWWFPAFRRFDIAAVPGHVERVELDPVGATPVDPDAPASHRAPAVPPGDPAG